MPVQPWADWLQPGRAGPRQTTLMQSSYMHMSILKGMLLILAVTMPNRLKGKVVMSNKQETGHDADMSLTCAHINA